MLSHPPRPPHPAPTAQNLAFRHAQFLFDATSTRICFTARDEFANRGKLAANLAHSFFLSVTQFTDALEPAICRGKFVTRFRCPRSPNLIVLCVCVGSAIQLCAYVPGS